MPSHPVQQMVVVAAALADFLGLIVINRYKSGRSAVASTWSWSQKRRAYHTLMFCLVALACVLDSYYHITGMLLAMKAYVFAIPVGLLDLYFSETRGVPLKVFAGAALWCSTVLIRQHFIDLIWPNGGAGLTPVIVREITAQTVPVEMLRYVGMLPLVGLFSDLIFSPMHRLSHHPSLYKGNHKVHHEYTNKLTALVLYHGSLLDDFLMPFTTAIGGFLYVLLLSRFGLEGQAFSNLSGYLVICNTLMSHAHDVRCARLMAPLPDSLNFVAYHYVHHLSPANNFGLTEPSDLLWDRLLGVQTIRKLEDFAPAAANAAKRQ